MTFIASINASRKPTHKPFAQLNQEDLISHVVARVGASRDVILAEAANNLEPSVIANNAVHVAANTMKGLIIFSDSDN